MRYAANARVYSVNAQAAAAWRELFGWIARESGVDLEVVDHNFPLPLAEHWARKDLACTFMCGYPFMLTGRRQRPVAAPISTNAPLKGRPVYATRLVVRAGSDFQRLEDTFGGRLGYTVPDSHSGCNALRHHLLPYYRARKAKLYRESVGPLTTPRRVIEALLAGTIDVGPLDSYALDLMLRHDENLRSQIRVIASMDPAPAPLRPVVPSAYPKPTYGESLRPLLRGANKLARHGGLHATNSDYCDSKESILSARALPFFEDENIRRLGGGPTYPQPKSLIGAYRAPSVALYEVNLRHAVKPLAFQHASYSGRHLSKTSRGLCLHGAL